MANLIIVPTFGSSITSLSNASSVEATINTAIGMYESKFSNPITVDITFDNMTTGLGQSAFSLDQVSYATFRSAIASNTNDPIDVAALTKMPACPPTGTCVGPVNNASTVLVKPADAYALGIFSGGPVFGGIISLNTGITNVSSPYTQNPSDYDLLSVTMHEIDEILGLGSTLGLSLSPTSLENDPSPEDFFRYAANGTRSFTTNSSALAYFSVTGAVDLAEFDNLDAGDDFGDWLKGAASPQVQDAVGAPGVKVNWGTNEITALEAVGYDLVPEPSTWFLLVSGLAGGMIYKKFRRALAG